jgi:Spy/CpxP family protein refolding chaperone
MKDNILKYILIVSLLMNLSLVGAAGYAYFKQSRYPATPTSGPSGSTTSPFRPGVPGNCLFEELSLKPDQQEVFQRKAVLFHQDMTTKRREVNVLRATLVTMMRADTPDNQAIEETIVKINRKQEDMQKAAVSHMLEFKSMLDKDQQKKFLDMIQGAMGESGQAICPG